MVSVTERIEAIIKYGHHKNVTSLSVALQMKNAQVFYDLQKGKVQNISAKLANKIILVYPEINIEWLLTGEGQMINQSRQSASNTLPDDAMQVFLNMSNTIVRQEENISKLADLVNRLTGGTPLATPSV